MLYVASHSALIDLSTAFAVMKHVLAIGQVRDPVSQIKWEESAINHVVFCGHGIKWKIVTKSLLALKSCEQWSAKTFRFR